MEKDEAIAHSDQYSWHSPRYQYVASFFDYPDPMQVEFGPYQLGGTLLAPMQQSQESYATRAPNGHPARTVVPPDPLTYSAHDTRAD